MVNRGEIEGDSSSYKLTSKFQAVFEDKLPDTFRFEEFMVWLYAFSGIPDGISSWDELFAHLIGELKIPGGAFAPEFNNRFKVTKPPTVPWPTDFLSTRPTNADFQAQLHPTKVAGTSAPTSASAAAALPSDDQILLRVKDAIEDGGECNFLFYGPPGTGKTMYAHKLASVLTDGDKKRVARIQFHPSLSYDDFVEGYSPAISPTAGVLYYSLSDRHFLEFCREAAKQKDKTFVVVIDEVSRGDPSRIFGDFLTYIDKDYRDEEFRLSYSQKPIAVPPNLIVIGTTNPYDRSVAELDDAFLRRFHMIEFKPDAAFLEKHFKDAGLDGGYADKVLRLFSELNRLMPHGFGHSHFMRLEGPQQLTQEWRAKLRFLVARTFQFDPDKLSEVDNLFEELFAPKAGAKPSDEDGDSGAAN